MDDRDELVQWLNAQSVQQPLTFDGITVNLSLREGGAEISAILGVFNDAIHLQRIMQCGFASALDFEAGAGLMPDGRTLLLSQWLPDVTGWAQAYSALENILNQSVIWRSSFERDETPAPFVNSEANQLERRLRGLFKGVVP